MTIREKRLQKIRDNPNNVSKRALDQVLQDFGFVPRAGKGSHTVYQHPDLATPVVVATHGSHVPAYIVKQALKAISRLGTTREEDSSED